MRKVSVLVGFLLLVGLVLTLVAQEQDLPPIMKENAATMASLRMHLDAKSAADVAKDAAKLQMLFTQAAGIFKAMKAKSAVGLAKAQAERAGAIATAANSNNLDAAAEPAGAMQKACKGCHDIHREQLPDKTFKFKAAPEP